MKFRGAGGRAKTTISEKLPAQKLQLSFAPSWRRRTSFPELFLDRQNSIRASASTPPRVALYIKGLGGLRQGSPWHSFEASSDTLVGGGVEGVCLAGVLRLGALLTFWCPPRAQPVFLTLVPASPCGIRKHADGLMCKLLAVHGATW